MRHRLKLISGTLALVVLLSAGAGYRLYRAFYAREAVEPDALRFATRGIDISAHNGRDIDFGRVKADGYDFVLMKATEGTDFKDRAFINNMHRARRAGLRVGAYHFFRFDTDGDAQAVNFINSITGRRLDFAPVIDVEEWGNPDGNATSQIIDRLRRMIERMEYFGYDVILYTNKDSYERFIRGNFEQYPLWIASFTEPDPDIKWSLWQYSHRGHVDGIDGRVDLNTVQPAFYRPEPKALSATPR